MATKWQREESRGLDLLDGAVQLLRAHPKSLFLYFTGSAPFWVAFLFFFSDMSLGSQGWNRLGLQSLGLALLFLWMKVWQSAFAQSLFPSLPPPHQSWLAAATRQALFHALGFFLVPLSLVLTLPFAWTYAYFQGATVLEDGRDEGLLAAHKRYWKMARYAPGQNHWLLLLMSFLSLCLFANAFAVLAAIPYLLKAVLGLESIFTRSYWALFNTSFLACVGILAFLCMDPLVKAAYALRAREALALESGVDLLEELERLKGAPA